MDNKKIVAISGYSRVGKNSFANEVQRQLKDFAPNLVVEQFSFADALRTELNTFIRENFNNISPWTEDDQEKKLIRPILIAYGNAKREFTNNKYWIEKINNKIERSNCDVALITDLRYAETENDELGWLKRNRGMNFHLKRYQERKSKTGKIVKVFEKAPNEHEKVNDPKIESFAKKVIEIPRFEDLQEFKDSIKKEVESIIGYFL